MTITPKDGKVRVILQQDYSPEEAKEVAQQIIDAAAQAEEPIGTIRVCDDREDHSDIAIAVKVGPNRWYHIFAGEEYRGDDYYTDGYTHRECDNVSPYYEEVWRP